MPRISLQLMKLLRCRRHFVLTRSNIEEVSYLGTSAIGHHGRHEYLRAGGTPFSEDNMVQDSGDEVNLHLSDVCCVDCRKSSYLLICSYRNSSLIPPLRRQMDMMVP